MDNAIATTAPTPLIPAPTGLGARWQALPGRLQAMAMFGVAILVGLLAVLVLYSRDSDYRVLLPGLSEKDGGQVIERLVQMNVPYRLAEGGTTIMVPSGRVAELRMKLAAAGLPGASYNGSGSSGAPGYELLDTNSFGQTQGAERMKFQRAKEGELVRSIQSLESVKTARVHLALPNQNGFFREQQKPSASVVLTLHPGRTLERAQIAGIVSLVSASVPEMTAKAVSVIDSSGALLSGTSEADSIAGLDSQQLQYRRDIEASHLKRVLALLEPVVGADNVRATVTAEVDFARVEQTAEAYRPNQGADAPVAIREQRSEETSGPGAATPTGVPGAQANQPQAPASAPINGPAQGLQTAGGGGAGGNTRREAATRYEVDRTVTVTRNAVGNVKRLSAAVVVNHRTNTDAKGKTTTVPLTDKEIEQLAALVQQGIGFNAERGDAVRVINAPFRTEVLPPEEATPIWQQPWLVDLLKTAAAPLALALVAWVVISKLIRPAVQEVLAPPPPALEPGSSLNEVVGDGDNPDGTPALPAPVKRQIKALAPPADSDKLEAARVMAKENPAAVANIVRGWVNGEPG
jgi:flagellar M-ring protein FliF